MDGARPRSARVGRRFAAVAGGRVEHVRVVRSGIGLGVRLTLWFTRVALDDDRPAVGATIALVSRESAVFETCTSLGARRRAEGAGLFQG